MEIFLTCLSNQLFTIYTLYDEFGLNKTSERLPLHESLTLFFDNMNVMRSAMEIEMQMQAQLLLITMC